MTLPGETEAGSAGMQPCRGIAWWAHRDDVAGRGSSPFALCPKPYRIGRPSCLENPRPEGAEYSLTESAPSPFHAEPEHPPLRVWNPKMPGPTTPRLRECGFTPRVGSPPDSEDGATRLIRGCCQE